jgi:hypothetical protein
LLSQRATDGAQLAASLTYALDVASLPGTTLRGRQSVLFTLRRCLSMWSVVVFHLALRLVMRSFFLYGFLYLSAASGDI